MILSHWPSADRLARATGVSPSAFRKWLKGEAEPSRERLVALAEVAQVNVSWLAAGEGPEPGFQPIGGGGRRRSGAGQGSYALDPAQFRLLPPRPGAEDLAGVASAPQSPFGSEFIALRQDWVRGTLGVDPTQLILQVADGESMQPLINHGDLLLVDASEREIHGCGVYVLLVDHQRLVKRVQRKLDGSLVLLSDHPAYQPDSVSAERAATIEVVGRVVWVGGRI